MKRHLVLAVYAMTSVMGLFFSSVAEAQLDRSPGMRTDKTATSVTGEVLKIEGPNYVVRDSFDKEVRLRVSADTKIVGTPPKVGDRIEAKVTEGGQTTAIQVTSAKTSRPPATEKGSRSDKGSGAETDRK